MTNSFISRDKQEKIDESQKSRLYHPPVTSQVVEVIMTITTEGAGTLDDPARIITRYFNKDGSLICAIDPCQN